MKAVTHVPALAPLDRPNGPEKIRPKEKENKREEKKGKGWRKALSGPVCLGLPGWFGVRIPCSWSQLHRVELDESQPLHSSYGLDLVNRNNP